MADNRSQKDDKHKSYYSLNLTEGRKFIIFIAFIIVVAFILIGVVIFTTSKNNQTAKPDDAKKNDNALAYYYSLTDEEAPKTLNTNDAIDLNSTVVQTNIDLTEDKIVKKDPVSIVDDSEVLYSSKFIDEENNKTGSVDNKTKFTNKTSTIPEKKQTSPVKKTATKEPAKTKNTVTKTTAKTPSKKYVVQVGSYSNKKIADEIADFYKNHGNYPTFVKDTVSKGKTFYRLRIGPFREKSRAELFLSYLKDTKYGKDSYISIIYN